MTETFCSDRSIPVALATCVYQTCFLSWCFDDLNRRTARGKKNAISLHQLSLLNARQYMPASISFFFSQTPRRRQALRAVRDRDRADLRALIAQKRKQASSSSTDSASAGAGNNEARRQDAPGARPTEAREWNTPSGWATGSPALPRPSEPEAKVVASDPPPRQRGRRLSHKGDKKGEAALKAAVGAVERPGAASSSKVSRCVYVGGGGITFRLTIGGVIVFERVAKGWGWTPFPCSGCPSLDFPAAMCVTH